MADLLRDTFLRRLGIRLPTVPEVIPEQEALRRIMMEREQAHFPAQTSLVVRPRSPRRLRLSPPRLPVTPQILGAFPEAEASQTRQFPFLPPREETGPVTTDAAPSLDEVWLTIRAPEEEDEPELQPDTETFYDYDAAIAAGAGPDASGHWPSEFKLPGHPRMVVGGFHTQTRERVPGTRRASGAELIELGWSPAAAQELDAVPEPTVQPMPSHITRRN